MTAEDNRMKRRAVLQGLLGLGGTVASTASATPLRFLKPVSVDNPLAAYPNRSRS